MAIQQTRSKVSKTEFCTKQSCNSYLSDWQCVCGSCGFKVIQYTLAFPALFFCRPIKGKSWRNQEIFLRSIQNSDEFTKDMESNISEIYKEKFMLPKIIVC